LVEILRALPIQFAALVVGLSALQIGSGSVQPGLGSDGVGFRGLHRSLVGAYIRRGLHVFQLRQQLTLPYVIPFLNVQVGDLAISIGADVDIGLGLDFARGAHHRGQVLALHFTGLHHDHILAALIDRESDDGAQ